MNAEVQPVQTQADVLDVLNRGEIDIQIATAKQYPRNIQSVLATIRTLATMDAETAEDCFYVLRRGNASGNQNVIEGVSVRMAEIIASCWGNIRVQTRIIANNGKKITAQAMCHDLESNFAISLTVDRRITDKFGKTYSEDMQVVTGNAAAAIAFRNAVLKVIPKAVTKSIVEETKKAAMGQSIDLETSRQNMIQYFQKLGVTEEQLLAYLDVKSVEEITKEKIFELRGTANAIKEGTTTVQETFSAKAEQSAIAEKAKSKAEELKAKYEESMKNAKK